MYYRHLIKPLCLIGNLICCSIIADSATPWQYYGGAPGGGHYSELNQITPSNVNQLKVAWIYHTDDMHKGGDGQAPTGFEATPIFFNKSLYFCTPHNMVIAVDPATGQQKWKFDPQVDRSIRPVEGTFVCRGVAAYTNSQLPAGQLCQQTIFAGTVDGRLMALDANTGQLCKNFGNQGIVNFKQDYMAPIPLSAAQMQALRIPGASVERIKKFQKAQGGSTSGPIVIGNKVVLGEAFDDNALQHMPAGVVQAFDAATGKPLWVFNSIPKGIQSYTGAGNAWGPLSADLQHNIIYIGTTSPSTDYYGADRKMPLPLTDAVIALNADTGEPIWHQQLVHHNLYDYELAAQPTLVNIYHAGIQQPVVIEALKTGMIFTFDQATGKPVFPITERAIPGSTIPGEQASPTQPAVMLPKPLLSRPLTSKDMWGITPLDRLWCQREFKKYDYNGLFTAPSTRGWVAFPFAGGGMNWGSVAYDPNSNLLIVNYSRVAQIDQLTLKADTEEGLKQQINHGVDAPMYGTPYVLYRKLFLSPLGIPCNAPPWGMLAAINMDTGKIVWQQPFGSVEKYGIDSPEKWGSPNMGGSMVTKSGLTFIGASMDRKFHAYNTWTGQLLWEAKLPSIANATPMTYDMNDKQYILIASGGGLGSPPNMIGDSVVAFALPDTAE